MGPEEYYRNEDQLDQLDVMFADLLHPPNLIKNFKTKEEFKKWVESGTIEDITETMAAFEPFELYDHLIIMRNVVKDKHMKLLTNTKTGI